MKRFLKGVIFTAMLSFALLLSFSPQVSAESSSGTIEPRVPVTTPVAPVESVSDQSNVTPMFVNDFRYRKKNVSTYYEWSSHKRASDNLSTYGTSGGTITATKETTFGAEISGNIYGIDVSVSGSVTNNIGYSVSIGPNRVVYLGYKVYYKVEKGTREYYDLVTGKVMSSNSYTVKVPQYGQYSVLNY